MKWRPIESNSSLTFANFNGPDPVRLPFFPKARKQHSSSAGGSSNLSLSCSMHQVKRIIFMYFHSLPFPLVHLNLSYTHITHTLSRYSNNVHILQILHVNHNPPIKQNKIHVEFDCNARSLKVVQQNSKRALIKRKPVTVLVRVCRVVRPNQPNPQPFL